MGLGLRYPRWASVTAWLNRRSSHQVYLVCFGGSSPRPREASRVGKKMADTPGLHPKGHGMERSSKRGKIPQKDWPSIMVRYEAGETLASIARTYDCSPPAISYIVSRSRARGAVPTVAAPSPPTPQGPQLVKTHATEPSLREPA